MGYWNQQSPYTIDKAIIAFADDISTPYSVTVNATDISADSASRKALPAGLFVAQVGNSVRFLPRGTVSAAFSTGAATGTVSTPANVFIPGDVLYIVQPYAAVTVAGTWATNDTATVTINGIAVTVTAGSSTLATVASNIAAAINANAAASQIVTAVASAAKVYILANDGTSLYSIAAAETTAGDGTATVDGSATALAYNNTAVGTVLTVAASTGVITLTGNAGVAVPVGLAVGVRVSQIFGVYPHSIDFTDQPTKDIAPVYSCRGVYKDALPYFDLTIAAALPNILFQSKF